MGLLVKRCYASAMEISRTQQIYGTSMALSLHVYVAFIESLMELVPWRFHGVSWKSHGTQVPWDFHRTSMGRSIGVLLMEFLRKSDVTLMQLEFHGTFVAP